MKKLFIYYVRRLVMGVTLAYVLGFLIFWGVITSLLIGVYKPVTPKEYAFYVSLGYGSTVLVSLSSFAIGVAFAVFFNTQALPFMFKFSKLTPPKYLLAFYSANLLDSEAIGVFTVLLFIVITWLKGDTVLPSDPALLAAGVLLEGLSLISISVFIELLALVKVKVLRYSLFLLYIPTFVSMASYFLYTM